MKVVLKKMYYSSILSENTAEVTRFFVICKRGREVEIKNLFKTFFPVTDKGFEHQLFKAYSGRRCPDAYRAESDYILGKPVDLTGEDPRYVSRYLDLLDMYYYGPARGYCWGPDGEDSWVEEVFEAEISPQALRVLIEPWKYGIDRRSCRNKRGS